MNEFVRRLLEGRAPWGTLDVSPASRGIWQQVRLTVYPPGITHAERRILHLAHVWPVGGGILCLFALVFLGSENPALSLAAALALYAGGFLILSRLARDLRSRCRAVTVTSEYVHGELYEHGEVALLRVSAERLMTLEAKRRHGEVDPVSYEAEWSDVFGTLPVRTSRMLQRR
ncbi:MULTISPECIES: DUF6611 family protein [unclassified Leifsonia]|uniref:DUF6611 family protein n=1 Tax=unclassified Leifsonia TaxID=2663824 RepID=UPI00106215C9|nr:MULTISPECIES: DUF6611 family protein [unclassified Leifsonia]TDP98465.1 hypothetical protein AXZ95_2362 [Leifsonia sp. 115AMFTsu3.1]